MTRDERIAQRLAIDGWKRQVHTVGPDNVCLKCGIADPIGPDCQVIPCPDLRTPENQAKVKAALAERGYNFRTGCIAKFWTAWIDSPRESVAANTCDTEADALLAAIDKLLEGDDDRR